MQIIPSFDKILVTIKLLRPTTGNIVLPDKSQNHESQMPYCEVLALGPTCTTDISVGDKVLVLPGNLIGFVDPRASAGSKDTVFVTSEQNVIGKYIEEESEITLN